MHIRGSHGGLIYFAAEAKHGFRIAQPCTIGLILQRSP